MSKGSKKRYKKRNREESYKLIGNIKISGECLDCRRLHSDVIPLEFHHRERKLKKDTVCRMASRGNSPKTVLKEIEKCDLLCEPCHTEKHRLKK